MNRRTIDEDRRRIRNTDEQITFVRALPDGFYYGGGKGVYLLDEKSASGKFFCITDNTATGYSKGVNDASAAACANTGW